jgi:hypothetical protein
MDDGSSMTTFVVEAKRIQGFRSGKKEIPINKNPNHSTLPLRDFRDFTLAYILSLFFFSERRRPLLLLFNMNCVWIRENQSTPHSKLNWCHRALSFRISIESAAEMQCRHPRLPQTRLRRVPAIKSNIPMIQIF